MTTSAGPSSPAQKFSRCVKSALLLTKCLAVLSRVLLGPALQECLVRPHTSFSFGRFEAWQFENEYDILSLDLQTFSDQSYQVLPVAQRWSLMCPGKRHSSELGRGPSFAPFTRIPARQISTKTAFCGLHGNCKDPEWSSGLNANWEPREGWILDPLYGKLVAQSICRSPPNSKHIHHIWSLLVENGDHIVQYI